MDQGLLKLELFQHSGSFKARAAILGILALDNEQRSRGVTAVSAGNHAIAVAFAAARLGVSAKLVMQSSAEPIRVAAAREYGAEVILGGDGSSSFTLAETIARREGRTFLHPFEGPTVALATATLGLELLEQAHELHAVVVAVGGGGLAGGLSAAIRLFRPDCEILGVEPAGSDSMRRSFLAGAPQRLSSISTIADSLAPPMALPYSFELCRAGLHDLVTVDDEAICRAMALLFRRSRLVVEPAGAAAAAAALGPYRERLAGKRFAIVVCGANIGIEKFAHFVRLGDGAGV